MASKPTDLTVVTACMHLDNVVGVLARVRKRITDGDLKDARGVLVIVIDSDGATLHDQSETVDDSHALVMARLTEHRLCAQMTDDTE
jgi:hypothetical protein